MLRHEIVLHEESLPVNIRSYTARDHLIPGHWHSHVEILLIKRGRMEVQCARETRTLNGGDVFIINSGEIHQTRVFGETVTLLLQMPYFLISRSLPGNESVLFDSPPPRSPMNGKLASLLNELLEVHRIREKGYIFLFQSLLHKLLYHLVRDCSSRSPLSRSARRDRTKMQNLLTFIDENYTSPLSVQQGADFLGLNRDYFCRYFKKQTGSTFLEYLNLIRLSHIRHDLLATEETLTELMERHGFTNYKVFSRMFREHYNSTPSRFRKAAQIRP